MGITEQDADIIVKWRSDLELIRYFRNPIPLDLESHNDWFYSSYINDDSRFDFMINEKASGQRIGTVSVNAIDYAEGSAKYRI